MREPKKPNVIDSTVAIRLIGRRLGGAVTARQSEGPLSNPKVR